jgi:putative transposase
VMLKDDYRRKDIPRLVSHWLDVQEYHRIMFICNQPQYASLPPGQIMPALADRGSTSVSRIFLPVLHADGQAHWRGRWRQPQELRALPRLRAPGPNQL